MKGYLERAREIPVITQTEVLVVGAGPAGLAAALSAARMGADTLLVERYGYVGGLCTGGLVIGVPPAREQAADNPAVLIEPPEVCGVITKEIHARLDAMGAAVRDYGGNYWSWWFPEETKWLGLQMLKEAGVRLLFHVVAGEAIMEASTLRGVIVESKAGPQAILARQTIDCSGDADVAVRAGAPYIEGDGRRWTLPISLVLMVGGIDGEAYEQWRDNRPPESLQPGRTVGWDFTMGMRSFRGGEYMGMHGHVAGAYAADPIDLTRAENEARNLAMERLEWLRKNVPGCQNAYLSFTAPQLGVRESRFIQGEYVLTGPELQSGVVFEDHIGFIKEGKSVPYRALVPQGADNLLIAGRPISQDHSAVEATRSIPPCFVTGFAAGVAAAQAAATGIAPRRLDVADLQTALKRNGVLFAPET